MDAREILTRYKLGVTFACGCQERDLHPAVEKALLAGRIDPAALQRCAVHRQPLIDEAATAAAGPGDPLIFA